MSDILTPKQQAPEAPLEFNGNIRNDFSTATEMTILPLKNFFQIKNPTTEERNQMDFIYRFFDKLGTETMTQVIAELGKISRQLGTAPFSQSTLSQIYNYLKIQSQISDLEDLKLSFHAPSAK